MVPLKPPARPPRRATLALLAMALAAPTLIRASTTQDEPRWAWGDTCRSVSKAKAARADRPD